MLANVFLLRILCKNSICIPAIQGTRSCSVQHSRLIHIEVLQFNR